MDSSYLFVNRWRLSLQTRELWLQPMTKKEREQISKLASLYSLHIRSENGLHQRSCPVLSKTANTSRPPDTLAIENLLLKSQNKLPNDETKFCYAAGIYQIGCLIGGVKLLVSRLLEGVVVLFLNFISQVRPPSSR